MKKLFKITLLLIFTSSFSSCEKDDICAEETPTTPRLIIEFYDSINTSVLKNVANLKATGNGASTSLEFNGVNTIRLPLKTNENFTQYTLEINSTSITATKNTDLIKFNYTTNDIYISRACGFKSQFDLNLLNATIKTNPVGDVVYWIKNIEIIKNKIETEDDIHIKMYF